MRDEGSQMFREPMLRLALPRKAVPRPAAFRPAKQIVLEARRSARLERDRRPAA